MLEFLRYFKHGLNNAIILHTPDYRTNNQFTDMDNISNDFKISISKVVKQNEQFTRRTIKRDRKISISEI